MLCLIQSKRKNTFKYIPGCFFSPPPPPLISLVFFFFYFYQNKGVKSVLLLFPGMHLSVHLPKSVKYFATSGLIQVYLCITIYDGGYIYQLTLKIDNKKNNRLSLCCFPETFWKCNDDNPVCCGLTFIVQPSLFKLCSFCSGGRGQTA